MRHRPRHPLSALIALSALALVGSCTKQGPIEPAPPPRRPDPPKIEPKVERPTTQDCQPVDAAELPASVPYRERSVAEAENLANDGFRLLRRSEDRSVPRPEREELITEAVEKFIISLKADPYNVHATYNLAAAYARIGRRQCALNMLERLLPLGKLASQKDEVDLKLDRLLGRAKFKGRMDPDFYDMRDDPGFRELVRRFEPTAR
jgi:hypothetical protein